MTHMTYDDPLTRVLGLALTLMGCLHPVRPARFNVMEHRYACHARYRS